MEGMPGVGGGRGGRSSRGGKGGIGGGMAMAGGGGGGGGGARSSRSTRTTRQNNANGAVGMVPGGPGAMGGPGMMPGMMGMPQGNMAGGMMGGGPGMGGMPQQQRTATVQKLTDEERKSQKTLKIWATDFFGTPGKTYKYRIRVVMYNPLAGYKPYLEDPANTLLTGIASSWTEVGGPVRLENAYYCFAESLGNDKKSVKFNVIKWHSGSLYSESFMVKEGEAIGGKKKIKLLASTKEQVGEDLGTEEVDFDTGLTLAEFSAGQADREVNVTVKSSDGQSIKQNSIQVKESSDYKKSQEALKDQSVKIRKWKKELKEQGTVQ
jgi:hypothetical protein